MFWGRQSEAQTVLEAVNPLRIIITDPPVCSAGSTEWPRGQKRGWSTKGCPGEMVKARTKRIRGAEWMNAPEAVREKYEAGVKECIKCATALMRRVDEVGREQALITRGGE